LLALHDYQLNIDKSTQYNVIFKDSFHHLRMHSLRKKVQKNRTIPAGATIVLVGLSSTLSAMKR